MAAAKGVPRRHGRRPALSIATLLLVVAVYSAPPAPPAAPPADCLLVPEQADCAHYPNRTTFICRQSAVSQSERGNCTLTTRAEDGRPTPGADPTKGDFVLVPPDELRSPSAWYGGPAEWFIDFATCEAGLHNVTVMVRGNFIREYTNITASLRVVPSVVSNFTLDCAARSGREVVAGSTVTCEMVTVDGCANPSGVPTQFPSEWQAALVGSAISAQEASSQTGIVPPTPVVQVSGREPYAYSRGGRVPTGALYTAEFQTGHYWTPELNYTERGSAGLAITLGNINWTEGRAARSGGPRAALVAPQPTSLACGGGLCRLLPALRTRHASRCCSAPNWRQRCGREAWPKPPISLPPDRVTAPDHTGRSSTVSVRAAALSAANTLASCEPATGLLQWHTATCYLNTYDRFGNPQLGAKPSDFVATYLANPGPLGESAGALEPTERQDVFAIKFQVCPLGLLAITPHAQQGGRGAGSRPPMRTTPVLAHAHAHAYVARMCSTHM